MTVTTIAIAAVLIVFVLARRIRGEVVPAPRKLFVLPLVVGAIGVDNVSHAKPDAVDIAVIVAGCALSLVLGLLRGRLDKVSLVDGAPFMAWGTGSVAVFVVNVVAKLAVDAGGVAAGGTAAALSSSILLSLGLTFLGEAAVVWLRAQSLASGSAAGGRYRGTVQRPDRPTIWPPSR